MRAIEVERIDEKEIRPGSLLLIPSHGKDANSPNLYGRAVTSSGESLYLTVFLRPSRSGYVATGFVQTKQEVIDDLERFKLKMSSGNATDLMLKEIAKRNNVEYKPSVKRVDSMPKAADFDDIP